MRPLTAITLIIPGSRFAIMVGLTAVIIVVRVLGDEYPRLQHEFDPLLTSLLIFAGMTVISTASFYSLLKNHAAPYWGQVRMWVGYCLPMGSTGRNQPDKGICAVRLRRRRIRPCSSLRRLSSHPSRLTLAA